MANLKTGARLKSTVCNGEIMVVSAPDDDIEVTCGGASMVDPSLPEKSPEESPKAEVHPDHAVGIAIGKRYVSETGDLEVLCVKAGDGGLAMNGALLLQKDTKKLPKTD